MGKWSGLIVLAIIVLNIIGSIIQNRRKEQEKQRAREEMARRRAMAEAQGQGHVTQAGAAGHGGVVVMQQPPGQTSMTGGMPATVALPPRTPMDDLEARRRAQLEQLRQRRDGRRVGQPSPMAGGAAPPTSPRAGMPGPAARGSVATQSSSTFGSSDQARTRQQEADQRARQQALQMREQQRRLSSERDEMERATNERERQRRDTAAKQAEQRRSTVAAAAAAAGPLAAGSLAQRLHQPAALRDLIVLKEVLDRPLAMREQAREPG